MPLPDLPTTVSPELRAESSTQYLTYALAVILIYASYTLYVGYASSLRKLPGPFLARFTRLYLLRHAAKGDAHTFYLELHRKYGPIVRVAPNKVSIGDPDAIAVIYGTGSKYYKSAYYDPFRAIHEGQVLENLFAMRNLAEHKRVKATVASAYSVSSLRQLEPLVDECTSLFMDGMSDLAGKPVDLGEWLQWYAFDVIGNITFMATFGFLENQADKDGVIDALEMGNRYNTVVGNVPELHPWLMGNERLLKLLMRIPSIRKANPVELIRQMTDTAISTYDPESKNQRGDFLEFLRRTQDMDPERLSDRDLTSSLFVNLIAGSDTTAMALRAIFYFLVKNPKSYAKLAEEIDAAEKAGRFSEVVEYQQALELPYLQAVIKEAMRLHPGVGVPLERVVPDGGAELCSQYLPAGTEVGINAWVVHRDEGVWGRDAHEFRPERWIDAEPEQLKKMEHCFFSFGGGARTCIGKNISLLEMSKLVPQVLRRFALEWAGPNEEWELSGYFFVKQSGVRMRLVEKGK